MAMEVPAPHQFRHAAETPAADRCRTGESLLAAAWAGLASARYEAVDIHLRTGQVITNVLNVRIDGVLGEAACRRDEWTCIFAVEDVVMIRRIARGRRQP